MVLIRTHPQRGIIVINNCALIIRYYCILIKSFVAIGNEIRKTMHTDRDLLLLNNWFEQFSEFLLSLFLFFLFSLMNRVWLDSNLIRKWRLFMNNSNNACVIILNYWYCSREYFSAIGGYFLIICGFGHVYPWSNNSIITFFCSLKASGGGAFCYS